MIVDAQSVKNTDSAREKGYDAGKKVSGIKRHIAVDTQGLPHAIAVTTADVTDRKGALHALGRCATDLQAVQTLLADGGYVGQPFAQAVDALLGAEVQLAKRSELHTFAVMPQRWVVERSFLGRQMPPPLEKLRAETQYQLAVHPLGFPRTTAQKIVNRF